MAPPPLARLAGATGLIGGVPVLVLGVLLLEGAVDPLHGLLALAAWRLLNSADLDSEAPARDQGDTPGA